MNRLLNGRDRSQLDTASEQQYAKIEEQQERLVAAHKIKAEIGDVMSAGKITTINKAQIEAEISEVMSDELVERLYVAFESSITDEFELVKGANNKYYDNSIFSETQNSEFTTLDATTGLYYNPNIGALDYGTLYGKQDGDAMVPADYEFFRFITGEDIVLMVTKMIDTRNAPSTSEADKSSWDIILDLFVSPGKLKALTEKVDVADMFSVGDTEIKINPDFIAKVGNFGDGITESTFDILDVVNKTKTCKI